MKKTGDKKDPAGAATYSSPNRMVWEYFAALRRLVATLDKVSNKSVLKQEVAICIMLAVCVVEAFLNIFFRIVVSEKAFSQHAFDVLKDLRERKSLDYKVKNWPKSILGQGLDFQSKVPKAFLGLKDRRNDLMHFTSSHDTLTLPGLTLHGAVDTSAFDTLTADDASEALEIAEGMICELFRLRGVPEEDLDHVLHLWTGKPPK
ncbi:hypothetical protein KAX17_17655 [Candidatus Bipolaricaulota bacterium]|nr:hypothetical protein [Candidatus Bipolaricaulota bacterium]